MCNVEVNLENMTASVGGGAYLEEVDKALSAFNLAVPVGMNHFLFPLL